jgi:hypothetical protein
MKLKHKFVWLLITLLYTTSMVVHFGHAEHRPSLHNNKTPLLQLAESTTRVAGDQFVLPVVVSSNQYAALAR